MTQPNKETGVEEFTAYALYCNGKLLNDCGRYCKKKDQPAIVLSKRAIAKDLIDENGWDLVEVTVTPLPT